MIMESVIGLINENSRDHSEFGYYLSIIEEAKRNLSGRPDICIEICKSLIEGISKSIIERLDKKISRENFKNAKVSPLTKQVFKLLREHKEYDDVIGIDFARASAHLAKLLAELRNERGDISHGKAVPKLKKSNERLAYLAYQMTEGIISYMLDSFFRISEKLKDEKRVETDFEPVQYEDNEDFNNFLDTDIPWDGKLLYSKALYELYYEDYLIRLEDYKYSDEEIESEPSSI